MKLLADRSLSRIFKAFFGLQHYMALAAMFRIYPRPFENLIVTLPGMDSIHTMCS